MASIGRVLCISASDSLYNGSGKSIVQSAKGNAGRHVGQGTDLFGTHKYRHFLVGAGSEEENSSDRIEKKGHQHINKNDDSDDRNPRSATDYIEVPRYRKTAKASEDRPLRHVLGERGTSHAKG